jgi:hypothetical protein
MPHEDCGPHGSRSVPGHSRVSKKVGPGRPGGAGGGLFGELAKVPGPRASRPIRVPGKGALAGPPRRRALAARLGRSVPTGARGAHQLGVAILTKRTVATDICLRDASEVGALPAGFGAQVARDGVHPGLARPDAYSPLDG